MKRITYPFLLVFIIFLTPFTSSAQGGFSWDRVIFGGGFGAGFSSYQSIVAISPTVGYRLTERFTAGVGGIYQYQSLKLGTHKFSMNNYGAKVFGTFQLNEFLIAHTEYEHLNLEYVAINNFGAVDQRRRIDVGSLLVGGGYRQMMGSRSMVDIMVLFNLTETPYTPYSNPIIRIGFGVGL